MYYTLLWKQITKFQSIYSPNHIAANLKGCVKIPNVVDDIEKADLQESDHRYKIRVGLHIYIWYIWLGIQQYDDGRVMEKMMIKHQIVGRPIF